MEIVRAVYEEPPPVSRELLETHFDPEVEWFPADQSLLAGETYRGYEGIERFFEDLLSAWDEYLIEPEEFRSIGNEVVVVNKIRAHTREIEIDEMWSSLWTLRDRRIVRYRGFASPDGGLEAAGLRE